MTRRLLILALLFGLAACDSGPPRAQRAWQGCCGLTAELVTRFVRHQGEAREMVFHPGGRLLAATGTDGRIELMRASDGALWRLITHPGGAPELAMSPDGSMLVSGGYDRTAR